MAREIMEKQIRVIVIFDAQFLNQFHPFLFVILDSEKEI